jgi:molybdopterin biosynthesis enzyme MoaB
MRACPTQEDAMEKEKEKKAKKLKELFVQDLARIQGGTGVAKKPKCPEVTTLACGEEGTCSGC